MTYAPKRILTVFVLAMINVSIMLSLRSLPLIAGLGLSSLFYFLIVGIFFLVPSALVSAELATGWPKEGGVYVWVREALGDRWGFFSIWLQWIHNIAWFPVIFSFIATTFASFIHPQLAENKIFVLSIILISFWGITLLNYFGIRVSSQISSYGVILGTIVPGIFIVILGVSWFFSGHPLQIELKTTYLLPKIDSMEHLVFLAGLFLAFTGLEVSSSLAAEVVNPQKNYPRAILLAAIVSFLILALGALSIAIILPTKEIGLVSGLVDAFAEFLPNFHLSFFLPILEILLIFGAISEANSWIISPIKGLHATAIHGNLPPVFQRVNAHGTPTNLLIFQALLVTIVSFVFLFVPNISSGFWILTALSAQSYLIMYIFLFISAIRLRYTRPNVPRVYKIPFPHKGIWILSCMGIFSSIFAILLGFVPPTHIEIGSFAFYEFFLIIGLFLMCLIPLIIYQCKNESWFLPNKGKL